jgi:ParB-like chromosome segregation protein Spo0J
MKIRDRVVELVRVRAGDIEPHPRNWRTHPAAQRAALRGVLEEVGFVGALLARRTSEGRLQLIDGHLRAETAPEANVPVLVLDVTEEEADKILATHDPLAAMAGADVPLMTELLESIKSENDAVRTMIDEMRQNLAAPIGQSESPGASIDIPRALQIVVECDDEQGQRSLYERLTEEGYRCRVLTL